MSVPKSWLLIGYLTGADGFSELVIKAGCEAFWRCGAFGQHPGGVCGGGIARYLEGQDDGFQILQAKLLFSDMLDLPGLSAGSLGDLADHSSRVEFLADGDAAAQSSFPPPVGLDPGKVIPHEHCGLVGQELVEVIGHAVFISASPDEASRARGLRLSYTNATSRQRGRYEESRVDRQPPDTSPFDLLEFRYLACRPGLFELEVKL